jgi:hypothetical protein
MCQAKNINRETNGSLGVLPEIEKKIQKGRGLGFYRRYRRERERLREPARERERERFWNRPERARLAWLRLRRERERLFFL